MWFVTTSAGCNTPTTPLARTMPTKAYEGQPRPTKRKKGSKVPKVCVFFIVHLFIYYYEAREGPQQPTTANAGPRRRKRPQMTTSCRSSPRQPAATHPPHLWPGRRPRRPTKAPSSQEGQPRPMKRKKGPKVPKVRVFFIVHLFIYYYEAREGPQQPTTANAGPRRRKRAQTTPGASFGP